MSLCRDHARRALPAPTHAGAAGDLAATTTERIGAIGWPAGTGSPDEAVRSAAAATINK
jgi:hypothetical protein